MDKRKTKAGTGGADRLSDNASVRNRGLSGIAVIRTAEHLHCVSAAPGPHNAHAATSGPGPPAGIRTRNATAAIGGPHNAHAATSDPGLRTGTRTRNATAARLPAAALRPP